MKYKIQYHYRTGDSFHTEEQEDILEFEWESLELAKENLARIEEHYRWYLDHENFNRFPILNKRQKKQKPQPPSWWNVVGVKDNDYTKNEIINLKMDNGKNVQFHCPWIGYFESLLGAKIIVDQKGMSFEI